MINKYYSALIVAILNKIMHFMIFKCDRLLGTGRKFFISASDE